jgi:hypothetical protein
MTNSLQESLMGPHKVIHCNFNGSHSERSQRSCPSANGPETIPVCQPFSNYWYSSSASCPRLDNLTMGLLAHRPFSAGSKIQGMERTMNEPAYRSSTASIKCGKRRNQLMLQY